MEGLITIVYGIKTKVWRAFSSMIIEQPKLAQLDKVQHTWFTAKSSDTNTCDWDNDN